MPPAFFISQSDNSMMGSSPRQARQNDMGDDDTSTTTDEEGDGRTKLLENLLEERSDDDGGVVEEGEEVEESRLEEREIPAHFFPRRRNRGFSLLSSSPFLALTPGVNKCNRIGLSLSLSFFLHPRRNWIAAKPPPPSPLAKKMRKRKRMEKFRLNRVLLLLLFPTCREKHTCLSPSLCLHIFSPSNFHVSTYV